jgi:hypothetical protein
VAGIPETLANPCQPPYMASRDSYGKQVICGICLKATTLRRSALSEACLSGVCIFEDAYAT